VLAQSITATVSKNHVEVEEPFTVTYKLMKQGPQTCKVSLPRMTSYFNVLHKRIDTLASAAPSGTHYVTDFTYTLSADTTGIYTIPTANVNCRYGQSQSKPVAVHVHKAAAVRLNFTHTPSTQR